MRLDSAAHLLKRAHLMPGWLFRLICDRFEASLWPEFETTEPEIDAMMADGEPAELIAARIYGWYCGHISMTASLPGLLSAPTSSYCGCVMQPIYETRPG